VAATSADRKPVVVFESTTVYPGVTEDITVRCWRASPSLTRVQDFFVGYSPGGSIGRRLHGRSHRKVIAGENDAVTATLAESWPGLHGRRFAMAGPSRY
jgi:UDP-N-acetyl-D-mannosaminuronate dehydrogenase